MKEMICIVCPRGCRLKVDEDNGFAVTGNACPRGEVYGKQEATNPVRMLTSTVKITGARHSRCPVRTSQAVPKGKLFEIMGLLDKVTLSSPVKTGQVVLANVAGTGADIVVTKTM